MVVVRRSAVLVIASLLLFPACRGNADLKSAARIIDVTTGWFDDDGVKDGKNRLVPSISFRVRNDASQSLGSVQCNLLFKRVIDKEEWTTSFIRAIGPDGLAPGKTTDAIVVRAQQGYTGTQARVSMLQNTQFVDFKVEVFAKQGPSTWVKLGEYPIQRQLLTQKPATPSGATIP